MIIANPSGFTLSYDPDKSTWWDTVWHFQLDRDNPMTFISERKEYIQPDRSYHTNLGSIPRFPPFLRALVPPTRFPCGFAMHDSGYASKGLWIDGRFCRMSRREVDNILYDMILCDPRPGTKLTAYLVWSQVRMYGGMCGWGKGDIGKRGKHPPMGSVLIAT